MAGTIRITPDAFMFTRMDGGNPDFYSGIQFLFKTTWDHLKYLETLGITTEIARNTGSVVDGRGGGTGWFDQYNRFGYNAWSVFRWNSNSNRSWEWYMLIQNCDQAGPAAPGLPGYTIPGLGNSRGFCVAAAITISGNTSGNPWAGVTGSLGSDLKNGSRVWNSASNAHKIFCFPEANGVSGTLFNGTNATSSNGLAGDFAQGGNSAHRRLSIVSDDDSIVWMRNNDDNNWTLGYMGLYEPFFTKNVNGVEDTTTPRFVCYWNWTFPITPAETSEDVGSLTVNAGDNEQGACVVMHEQDSQMRGIRTLTTPDPTSDDVHLIKTAGRLANPAAPLHDYTFSLRSPNIFGSTMLYQGAVGRFDPRLLQITNGVAAFSRIQTDTKTMIVFSPRENDSNLINSYAVRWHPDAPMLEYRDRFGERRRFVVTGGA